MRQILYKGLGSLFLILCIWLFYLVFCDIFIFEKDDSLYFQFPLGIACIFLSFHTGFNILLGKNIVLESFQLKSKKFYNVAFVSPLILGLFFFILDNYEEQTLQKSLIIVGEPTIGYFRSGYNSYYKLKGVNTIIHIKPNLIIDNSRLKIGDCLFVTFTKKLFTLTPISASTCKNQ
jgi:hypothetical protein